MKITDSMSFQVGVFRIGKIIAPLLKDRIAENYIPDNVMPAIEEFAKAIFVDGYLSACKEVEELNFKLKIEAPEYPYK